LSVILFFYFLDNSPSEAVFYELINLWLESVEGFGMAELISKIILILGISIALIYLIAYMKGILKYWIQKRFKKSKKNYAD
jgi:hypothetical protein